MRVSEYVRKQLIDLLDEHRIVVWYDGERAFEDFVASFTAPHCQVVSSAQSILQARRNAEMIYRQMNESSNAAAARANLLIYVPRKRFATTDERTQDPFEVLACAGEVFGTQEGERLLSLARQAMPEHVEHIERLFADSRPTLRILDEFKPSATWMLLEQAFGTQSAVEIVAHVLCAKGATERLDATPGVQEELLRLLESEIGFKLPARVRALKTIREHLAAFVLFSEFAFDLPGTLPDTLANIPRAESVFREPIYAICDRMRDSEDYRQAYIMAADQVEQQLKLPQLMAGVADLGVRDTFGFEERQHLAALTRAVSANNLTDARSIHETRRRSVWRHQATRAQVWTLAERCVNLLESAQPVASQWKSEANSIVSLIQAYTRPGGWSELDRQQRLMEQSFADCAESDELMEVVDLCRRCYREVINVVQERFLALVQQQGWPPEGVLRQTQLFDRIVAPILERREKVAYILADALRFEMGRDLSEALTPLGEVNITSVAAALPTVTVVGMAALMPHADGALTLKSVNDQLVPFIGEHALPYSEARMQYLREEYGDRFRDFTLGEFLSLPDKRRRPLLTNVDLVVLRVGEIDTLGENVNLWQARKFMSEMLGELKTAATHLVRLGYTHIVMVADHGHVLLPEVLPGDVASGPQGTWLMQKRRSRIGSQLNEQKGTVTLRAETLGIQGDIKDLAVPNSFHVYTAGAGYFHEGISLQECVVPLIEVRAKGQPAVQTAAEMIELRYRTDRFTSRVIGLKVWYSSLLNEPVRVKIEAFDGTSQKALQVGEAADSDARDPTTHEVILTSGQETEVPLLIAADFEGPSIEVRATSPESSVVWHRLKLKNGIMD